jgi:putative restriction endonuclease
MSTSKPQEFLFSEEWDVPFFKRLAHNDTGRAKGHQGGFVIPKALRPFFPVLDESRTSKARPTIDRRILVHMFDGLRQVGEGRARYQFQTWGGERSAEGRLTDNLVPIRSLAKQGDILVFQRSADTLSRFRLILFQRRQPGFREISSLTEGRRWGPLLEGDAPVTTEDLETAEEKFDEIAKEPFVLKTKRKRVESRISRVARSSAFPTRVNKEYQWTCAISGVALATPSKMYEVQAAHVVPVSEGGTDDIRNGLALSHTLHWAFDWGLFGIREDRKIYIPRRIRRMVANTFLREFHGKPIIEARTEYMRVHEDALAWHMKHRVRLWD